MEHGIYLSAAGALAAESELDVVANNMANVDTPGFKRRFAVFQQRLAEAIEPPRYEPSRNPVLDQVGGGIFVNEVHLDPTNGSLSGTGHRYDVALNGDGWFTVEDAAGDRLYTRAGNFTRNTAGRLVTADGKAQVLDDKGKPINIPEGERVLVDRAGTILVNDQPVARLGIRGAVNGEYMSEGENLFRYGGEGEPAPAFPTVEHKFLERSNVSAVHEMVALIRTFRAYEANQRMITQQDQTFGRAVNDVGRLG